MTEHISCDCKCNFISTSCNSHRKWKNKTCQCQYENYKCNEGYSWNCRTCICENSKNLKSVADNLVADCDEIIIVLDIVSTKKTNIIATKRANITSTASINYHRKKSKGLLYLPYSFIIDHISIDNFYLLSLYEAKRYSIKCKIMNLKRFILKITSIISMALLN